MNIGFLGVGNMGYAILSGYNEVKGDDKIYTFGRNKEKLKSISESLNVYVAENISELVEKCDMIFLGVKPQSFEEILLHINKAQEQIKGLKKDIIYVSMAAGISIAYIKKIIGEDSKVVRIMPNTPAKYSLSATSISTDENISEDDYLKIEKIVKSFGIAEKIDEKNIHSVIGMSGSAPAYTYMYMKALIDKAVEKGIDKDVAKSFVAQTMIGAATMILNEDEEIETLIDNVCSKGGTTIEAVYYLKEKDFESIVKNAFEKAYMKSALMEK